MTGEESLRDRASRVLERIGAAAARARRNPETVRLIAVSKTQAADRIGEALAAGLSAFGENYLQEAEGKIAAHPGAEWHFIGHLQGNKVKKAVSLFSWIHTVDSAGLMIDVSRRAAEAGRVVPVLIEVNLAGEAGKAGVPPEGLPALVDAAEGLAGIRLRGLMAIPPMSDDPEASRPYFARLRELLERQAVRKGAGAEMTELSMGMSNDYEAAIEEGATMVRVGTAIFGSRPWKRRA